MLSRATLAVALAITLGLSLSASAEDYADADPSVHTPSAEPPLRTGHRSVFLSGLEAHAGGAAPFDACPSDDFEAFRSWFEHWSVVSALPYTMYPEGPGFQILDVSLDAGSTRTFDITPPYQVARVAICPMGGDGDISVQRAFLVADEEYCSENGFDGLPCVTSGFLAPANQLDLIEEETSPLHPLYKWGHRYTVTASAGPARIFIGGRLGKFPSATATQ